MSVIKDVWGLLKESPDERRLRLQDKQKPKLPHPDDKYGFSGMDKWSQTDRKKKK